MLPRKQRRGSSRASWLETGPLAGTGMPGPIHSSSPQFRWEAMRRQREPSARDAAGGTRGTYPQYFRSSPEGCNARGPRDGSAGEWQSDPLRSVRPVAQRPPPCFKEVIPRGRGCIGFRCDGVQYIRLSGIRDAFLGAYTLLLLMRNET